MDLNAQCIPLSRGKNAHLNPDPHPCLYLFPKRKNLQMIQISWCAQYTGAYLMDNTKSIVEGLAAWIKKMINEGVGKRRGKREGKNAKIASQTG